MLNVNRWFGYILVSMEDIFFINYMKMINRI